MNADSVCAASGWATGQKAINGYREGQAIYLRGKTGFRDSRLCRSLSRMRGNSHVRFLGEGTAVTLFPYPPE